MKHLTSLTTVLESMNAEEKERFYAQIFPTPTRQDDEALRQQTEMFWLLQLQFLSMNPESEAFYNLIWGIYYSPVYKNNKFTKKIKKLMFNRRWNWTEDDFACLCTHFALQLTGIEE